MTGKVESGEAQIDPLGKTHCHIGDGNKLKISFDFRLKLPNVTLGSLTLAATQ